MPLEVTSDRILSPLGVYVLRDSRHELMPAVRDYTEEVPGRHGEIYFGSEIGPRLLELHCACEVAPADRAAKVREIASYLDPTKGVQTLTFADEPGKVYHVRCAGRIEFVPQPWGFEFVIPFRMSDPYITSAVQHQLTGSGSATNEGNAPTPFVLLVQGEVMTPAVSVGAYCLFYDGMVSAGSTLKIDTEKMTVDLDGINALPSYNGVFPKLLPGANTVVAAQAGTTILYWYDRWI